MFKPGPPSCVQVLPPTGVKCLRTESFEKLSVRTPSIVQIRTWKPREEAHCPRGVSAPDTSGPQPGLAAKFSGGSGSRHQHSQKHFHAGLAHVVGPSSPPAGSETAWGDRGLWETEAHVPSQGRGPLSCSQTPPCETVSLVLPDVLSFPKKPRIWRSM